MREDDKLFLIILDHGSNTVYRRVVTTDELRKGKHLELLIREQWAS